MKIIKNAVKIVSRILACCFSDKTAPAIGRHIPVPHGLQINRQVFLKQFILILFFSLLPLASANVFAAIDIQQLQQQRIDIIKNYVSLLGRGDYREIPKLFTKHAVAVSATGESDNINHFYESLFMKTMMSPQSRLINIFDGQLKNNMMTAYYNLTWVGSDGVPVSKKFLDLFVFQSDSTKIKTIFVFSNDFHEDVFNQPDEPKTA